MRRKELKIIIVLNSRKFHYIILISSLKNLNHLTCVCVKVMVVFSNGWKGGIGLISRCFSSWPNSEPKKLIILAQYGGSTQQFEFQGPEIFSKLFMGFS